jgi:hypothetical protein
MPTGYVSGFVFHDGEKAIDCSPVQDQNYNKSFGAGKEGN